MDGVIVELLYLDVIKCELLDLNDMVLHFCGKDELVEDMIHQDVVNLDTCLWDDVQVLDVVGSLVQVSINEMVECMMEVEWNEMMLLVNGEDKFDSGD